MTTMTFDQARAVERAPIKIGERYEFYSTMQQEYEPAEKRIRNYTGQFVLVLSWENEDDCREQESWPEDEREAEPLFKVRAEDGFEFEAYGGELNGWHRDTGQFFWPDATYGPNHKTTFLSNERD